MTTQTINNYSEFTEAERTYQHLCYTARYYRSLINPNPAPTQCQALIDAREMERKHCTKQAERIEKEAEALLNNMIEYELQNRPGVQGLLS